MQIKYNAHKLNEFLFLKYLFQQRKEHDEIDTIFFCHIFFMWIFLFWKRIFLLQTFLWLNLMEMCIAWIKQNWASDLCFAILYFSIEVLLSILFWFFFSVLFYVYMINNDLKKSLIKHVCFLLSYSWQLVLVRNNQNSYDMNVQCAYSFDTKCVFVRFGANSSIEI